MRGYLRTCAFIVAFIIVGFAGWFLGSGSLSQPCLSGEMSIFLYSDVKAVGYWEGWYSVKIVDGFAYVTDSEGRIMIMSGTVLMMDERIPRR